MLQSVRTPSRKIRIFKGNAFPVFAEEVPSSVRTLVVDQINQKPELILPQNLDFRDLETAKRAGLKMKEFYFHNKTFSQETVDNLINASSDSWFVFGAQETAKLHAKSQKSPVYFYHFVLETEFGEAEKQIRASKPGPSHADDLKYFFYQWDSEIEITPEELEKITMMNNLWINFAKFGNPTPANSSDVIWEPFTPEKNSYLEIGDELVMKVDLEKERMEFWENLVAEENLTYY